MTPSSFRTDNTEASPWHPGELAIQESIDAVREMDRPGRLFVRNLLLDPHRAFYAQLPFVVIGSVDAHGDAWASIRAGAPGFLHSPDPQTLRVALARDPGDPADAGMGDGQAIGLLGIELATRRRNRMNGTVRRQGDSSAFAIEVAQSFGNCPRYIQNRRLEVVRDPALPSQRPATEVEGLDTRAREIIATADTFFVASYVDRGDGTRQVDVSHRGGKPGFVRVGHDGMLTIPDFSGNRFFMTLGNFLVNPAAGLLFIDPSTGDMLQMTGEARVVLDGAEIDAFAGAERLWTFKPRRVLHRPDGLPLRWRMEAGGWAPDLPMTGSWADVERHLGPAQATGAGPWRAFRVTRTVDETTSIRSIYLEPADGRAALQPQAGQHLPVRVTLADGTQQTRVYTLSMAPASGFYRISVKRQGRVSGHLHTLEPGAVIEALEPAGGFTLDADERRPAVLLAAGIGITPLLAMLHHIVRQGRFTQDFRPTWLYQAARTREDRAFDREIAELVGRARGRIRWIRTLSQPGDAQTGRDYEQAGHIDLALLRTTLPFDDYDFCLCGPAAFMQAIDEGLRSLDVQDSRIHAEAFGPSALTRSHDGDEASVALTPAATQSVRIVFAQSARETVWNPGDGPLLEVAEARGLTPAFGCRSGSCGTCQVDVLEGSVTYAASPSFDVPHDQALLCCALPAQSQSIVRLAL